MLCFLLQPVSRLRLPCLSLQRRRTSSEKTLDTREQAANKLLTVKSVSIVKNERLDRVASADQYCL
jgi:hypothetical protein